MDLEGGSHCMCLPSLFLIKEFYIDGVVGLDHITCADGLQESLLHFCPWE